MQLRVIFLSYIINSVAILCENKTNEVVETGNKFNLVGFIQGYKVGHTPALKYPGILVAPIIFVPDMKQEDKVNHQIQNVEKLPKNSPAISDNELDNNDIEINFRQALDKGSEKKKDLRKIKTKESILQSSNATMGTNTTVEMSTTVENISIETTTNLPSTDTSGPYPNAVYNNSFIDSLNITIKAPDDDLHPPLPNDQFKNFTTNTNFSQENTTKEISNSMNITRHPSVNETDNPIKGVYPAALYNNTEIDQLSITTNSLRNRSPLPPPQDDRWRSFGSLRKNLPTSNEFRPLAGLYYDGFLHKPILMTQGFVPYNHRLLRSV